MAKAPQRRRKSSLRTAPAALQDQFKARIAALVEDPLLALPDTIGEPVRPLAKLQARLEKMKARGKPGFGDKRDKGVAGGVAYCFEIARQATVPRLLDHKVAGARRFYLQRGHVTRGVSLGVQNHDDPRALLMAYVDMAKEHGLHFFAGDRLWCTGTTPEPPASWLDALATRAEVALERDASGIHCPHADERPTVILGFRGGPDLAVCGPCGKRARPSLHALMAARYAGPRRRQPFRVACRVPDGTQAEPERELLAKYRAGLVTEPALLDATMGAWRAQAQATSGNAGRRFILGEQDFGDDLDAFLDALGAEPWERTALAAMVDGGHVGRRSTVAAVLDRHEARLADGVAAILGGPDDAWWQAHRGATPRDMLRLAAEEARRREVLATLPSPQGLGVVGAFVDAVARKALSEGAHAARTWARANADGVPAAHLFACLAALAKGASSEVGFTPDQVDAGRAWAEPAAAVLESTGPSYLDALAAYLSVTGTGEVVSNAPHPPT